MTRPHDADADVYACADCHQLLPRAAFAKHARGLFGLNAACKPCMRVKSQKRWAETREKQRANRAALAPVAVTPKPAPQPTTPDPALAAALDRLIVCAYRRAQAHQSGINHAYWVDEQYAARAAVVACAAPARERVEARDVIDIRQAADDALQAGIALGRRLSRPSNSSKTEADCRAVVDAAWTNFEAMLASLDGEPEDAGAMTDE